MQKQDSKTKESETNENTPKNQNAIHVIKRYAQ